MRRGRKSKWEGEQWIVAQNKEKSEESKSKDKRIVMVKLIIRDK
jgi:hypothetical protein